MKNRYKIAMVLAILCLMPKTIIAQIVQYSEDGTESYIDPASQKSNSERSCLCIAPFQLSIFNTQISNFGGDERDRWLYEQELLLAHAITGVAYFDLYNSTTGVPANYNFTDIQRNYFKSSETDKLADEYHPKIDQYLADTYDYNQGQFRSATFNSKVLDIRKREGTTNPAYGDLKYKGALLRNISDASINSQLNQQLAIRNDQRANFVSYDLRRSRLNRALESGYLSSLLTDYYVSHYENLDYEEAIRFMTAYMAWINNRHRGTPYVPYGNPNNVLLLEDQDYTSLLAVSVDLGPSEPGYTPPAFSDTFDDAEVLHQLALNNMGSQASTFLQANSHLVAEDGVLSNNNYNQGILDRISNTIDMYQNNQSFNGSFDNYIAAGSGSATNLPTDLGVDLGYQFTFNNLGVTNGLRGYSNFLYGLFELDQNHQELEGSLMSAFFDSENVNLHGLTNQQLASLFNFGTVYPWEGRYEFNFFLEYDKPGIKDVLEQNDIDFFTMLDRPYVIDGAMALLDGQAFDFEFRAMVFDLANDLNLNQEQKEWLINNPDQVNEIDNFVIDNNSVDAINFAKDIVEILSVGNSTEKEIISELLKALNGNSTFNINSFLNPNETPTEIGPASFCDQLNWDPGSNPETLYAFGPGLIQDLTDAGWSLFIRGFEHFVSDSVEGDLIRDVFELRGIPISSDVNNETLGEFFQVFSEGGEFKIRYEEGIGLDLLNIGLDVLDIVTILSPSKGGGAYLAARGGGAVTKASMKAFLKRLDDISKTTLAGGRGYKSFDAFKKVEGNASSGNELHHIVEQNGFRGLNQQKFGKTNIHNTKNIVDIPGIVSGSLHRRITGYYNSIDSKIHTTKRVREAIKDWSFQEQYDFGIRKLKEFGWDGVTGLIN